MPVNAPPALAGIFSVIDCMFSCLLLFYKVNTIYCVFYFCPSTTCVYLIYII